MITIVIFFLGFSLLLYLLLGGADFGAGILELFTRRKNLERSQAITYRAIGPVWEANHMWLVLMVVILFVGYPAIFKIFSIHLHIPILALLTGIIARGTAFIFRHYDAIQDESRRYYDVVFKYSSFIPPLFLGMMAGALSAGKIDPDSLDFSTSYIAPWLNFYAVSVGIFTVMICAFLAAIYLIGEAENESDQQRFVRKAFWFNMLTVIAGAMVFIGSEIEGVGLLRQFIDSWAALVALILATISLGLLWFYLRKGLFIRLRILAGFQVSMILFAWLWVQFPDMVLLANGETLGLLDSAGPEGAIQSLAWALILGGTLILPALFYLFRSFGLIKLLSKKTKRNSTTSS